MPGRAGARAALVAGLAAVGGVTAVAAHDAAVLLIFLGLAVLPGLVLLASAFTYTEVGAAGVRVRVRTTVQTVTWAELVEVRWDRDDSGRDRLVFRTSGGREVGSHGVRVSDFGLGHRTAVRLLAHIERAWAQAGALQGGSPA
jgi:hypothetical protein